MGSVTYYDMAAHWPNSDESYAVPMNQIPKIVFSKSLKKAHWGETRIVAGGLATEIKRLKQEPGRGLLAHGGVRFAQSLIRTGLIDVCTVRSCIRLCWVEACNCFPRRPNPFQTRE